MANYNMVINSRFRPFSYQEMVAPLQQMTDAHNAQEAAMNELATKAATLESMVNSNPNSKAAATYRQYQDELKGYAEMLAKEGLNPTSTRNLYDARTSYAQNIVPIETALNRRRQLAEEQRQLKIKDPTALINRDAASFEIDDLISNPEMSYTSHSGENLRQQSALMASQLKNAEMTNSGWQDILRTQVGDQVFNQYFERAIRSGLTPNEILNSHEYTEAIRQKVLAGSDISTWGNQEALDKANNYISQGLYHAIGKTDRERLANKAFGMGYDPNNGGKNITMPSYTDSMVAISPGKGEVNPTTREYLNYIPYTLSNGTEVLVPPTGEKRDKLIKSLEQDIHFKNNYSSAELAEFKKFYDERNDEIAKMYKENSNINYTTKGTLPWGLNNKLQEVEQRYADKLPKEYIEMMDANKVGGEFDSLLKAQKESEIYGQADALTNFHVYNQLKALNDVENDIGMGIQNNSTTRNAIKELINSSVKLGEGKNSNVLESDKGEKISKDDAEEIINNDKTTFSLEKIGKDFKLQAKLGKDTYNIENLSGLGQALNNLKNYTSKMQDYSAETLTKNANIIDSQLLPLLQEGNIISEDHLNNAEPVLSTTINGVYTPLSKIVLKSLIPHKGTEISQFYNVLVKPNGEIFEINSMTDALTGSRLVFKGTTNLMQSVLSDLGITATSQNTD